MPTIEGVQRRKASRKKRDPQVIRLQLKDGMGNPRWATADLVDTSESGIGISVLAPLAIGSKIVIRGKLTDGGSEVTIPATVRWCTEKINGNFHAGLELKDGSTCSTSTDDSKLSDARINDELDHYEIMQLSPNADTDTIQRVYRILAQRYHPDSLGTGKRRSSSGCVRRIGSSVIPSCAPSMMRAIAKPSSSIGKSSIALRQPKDPRQNSASGGEF